VRLQAREHAELIGDGIAAQSFCVAVARVLSGRWTEMAARERYVGDEQNGHCKEDSSDHRQSLIAALICGGCASNRQQK
jgi:hypothetical protein